MHGNENALREALVKIAAAANEALGGNVEEEDLEELGDGAELPSCTPKALPPRLLAKAAETALRINPVNAPLLAPFGRSEAGLQVLEPARIALLTSKYWGAKARTLTVSFMESTPSDLRKRIISHMNAWTKTGGVSFTETSGIGQIRISRGGGGYYSYLGTDVLLIPKNLQTMNLQSFTMNTSEAEFRRVVRHETGHTLGCPHEHMRRALVARIDRQKAYAYFLRTQGWNKATVDAQVLTPLNEASLMATPADQTSIMCYQLPGSITTDGKPILGGSDINPNDYAFIGKVYPKLGSGKALSDTEDFSVATSPPDDWDAADDVEVEFDEGD